MYAMRTYFSISSSLSGEQIKTEEIVSRCLVAYKQQLVASVRHGQ